jgi:hypothetical protein
MQSGGSTIPDILRKVTVPIVSDDTCRGSYGTNAITDSMICAGFRLGISSIRKLLQTKRVFANVSFLFPSFVEH